MSVNVVSVAVLAIAISATSAMSQGLKGPAEVPPASFKGQQYVDSRGCVFLRAGYGGQVTWVPRVTRDRKQLCGYAPTDGQADAAKVAAPETAPEKAAAPAKAPDAPVAKKTKGKVASTAKAAPKKAASADAAPVEKDYRLACPKSTPVAERFAVQGGGSKVLCTKGDGSLEGANFPIMVAKDGSHKTSVIADGGAKTKSRDDVEVVYDTTPKAPTTKLPDVPKGYKLAWKDDRLNPNRGKQTVDGVLAQDEIWTRTVPAELREDSTVKRTKIKIVVRRADGSQAAHDGYSYSTKGGKAVIKYAEPSADTAGKSSKAAPEEAGDAHLKVQVGSFGVASNADGAVGKLMGLGLPVGRGTMRGAGGATLQVVYAGPFASAADAKAALAAARRAGFSDAVIVQ